MRRHIVKLPVVNLELYAPYRPSYSVKYFLINSDMPAERITLTKIDSMLHKDFSGICFSGLSSIGEEIDNYNRILYQFKIHKTLDLGEAKRWVSLARRYKLIPKYTKVRYGTSDSESDIPCYVVFDLNNETKNSLYVFLSTIRYLDEFPNFVKAIMELVSFKVNFYAAFVIASKGCIDRTVHHIVDCCRTFGSNIHTSYYNFYDTTVSLTHILGLTKFVSEIENNTKTNLRGSFRCAPFIKKLIKNAPPIKIKYLFVPRITRFIFENTINKGIVDLTDINKEITKLCKSYTFELPEKEELKHANASC